MPLIRYKLGDIGVIAPDPCECGRGLPVLSSICGRTSDQVIVTPDGKRVHSVIFDYFLERLTGMGIGIRQFKAVQERLDRITLYLVVPNEDDKGKTDLLVARDLAPSLGHRVRLETKHVPRIDLSPGKFGCFEAHPSLAGAWRGHKSQEESTNSDSSQSGER
jgi:phenylacetate-CoA ligase